MGYSFSTPCRSPSARDEMFGFLQEHYRPWSVLAAGSGCLGEYCTLEKLNDRSYEHTDWLRGPLTEDLSYDHGKCKIGFDYGMLSGGQRYWMYNFCYWMALRVGRKRTFSKKLPGVGALPYVLYDGHEAWPVLERSEFQGRIPKEEEHWFVDEGFRGWRASVEDWVRVSNDKENRPEGWTPPPQDFVTLQFAIAARCDEYLKRELERLSLLWRQR